MTGKQYTPAPRLATSLVAVVFIVCLPSLPGAVTTVTGSHHVCSGNRTWVLRAALTLNCWLTLGHLKVNGYLDLSLAHPSVNLVNFFEVRVYILKVHACISLCQQDIYPSRESVNQWPFQKGSERPLMAGSSRPPVSSPQLALNCPSCGARNG